MCTTITQVYFVKRYWRDTVLPRNNKYYDRSKNLKTWDIKLHTVFITFILFLLIIFARQIKGLAYVLAHVCKNCENVHQICNLPNFWFGFIC